jgi:hypothetical protein
MLSALHLLTPMATIGFNGSSPLKLKESVAQAVSQKVLPEELLLQEVVKAAIAIVNKRKVVRIRFVTNKNSLPKYDFQNSFIVW